MAAQTKKQVLNNTDAARYTGGNETIDRYLDDEPLWIVQGPLGRVPILAGTEEQALEDYWIKYNKRVTEDESVTEDEE